MEFFAQCALVDFTLGIGFFILGDEDGAVFAEQANDVEPIIKVGVFTAVVNNQGIEGSFSKEELVGGVVDFLAAEVPKDE